MKEKKIKVPKLPKKKKEKAPKVPKVKKEKKVKTPKVKKDKSVKKIAILPILCWFMALGGLSIFNVVYCDLKQAIVMLFCGHALSLTCHGGSE